MPIDYSPHSCKFVFDARIFSAKSSSRSIKSVIEWEANRESERLERVAERVAKQQEMKQKMEEEKQRKKEEREKVCVWICLASRCCTSFPYR